MSFRKTKIICTIGPASSGVQRLVRLAEAGMEVARLNFSHGTHEEHYEQIRAIREAEKISGKTIAILQDLQGPKIRIGKVENSEILLSDNAPFTITVDELEIGNAQRVSTTYKDLVKDVIPGKIFCSMMAILFCKWKIFVVMILIQK